MKKTLAAIAVLGTFAGASMAADVQLYGLVDYGFAYQHTDADVAGQDAQDSFKVNNSRLKSKALLSPAKAGST